MMVFFRFVSCAMATATVTARGRSRHSRLFTAISSLPLLRSDGLRTISVCAPPVAPTRCLRRRSTQAIPSGVSARRPEAGWDGLDASRRLGPDAGC